MPNNITITQHEYDSDTIDIVPIEPSLREGEFLRSSLRHPNGAKTLTRFPPQLLADPFITGDPTLPAILTCEVGTWNGSPQPSFTFQWMADGIDIPGFTNYREDFDINFDSQNITCEVRAFSPMGENYGFTTSVYVTIIEPIETRFADWNVTTGISAQSLLSIFKVTTCVTAGLSAPSRIDIQRSVAYFLTGTAANVRQDINTMILSSLNGLGSNQRNLITHSTTAAVSYNEPPDLLPGVTVPVPMINPSATMGRTGWTNLYEDYPIRYLGNTFGGTDATNYYWEGRDDSSPSLDNIPYNYLYQDVDMPANWHSAIDTGNCNIKTSWLQYTDYGQAQGNIRVDFFNVLGNVISTYSGAGMAALNEDIWIPRSFVTSVPTGTRCIRYYIETQWSSGNDTAVSIDSIVPLIQQGNNFSARAENGGPNYSMWRINAESLHVGSYVSLGELEFRSSIGGVDLCSGGDPINGSFDYGGDKQYAFDDLRDANFWASEANAISTNKAWIGYDFGTSLKPVEISITGRLGSQANQMAKSFYLEGSDDGVDWVKVQRFFDVPVFQSLQQVQLPVLQGNQSPIQSSTVSMTTTLHSDGQNTVGAIFKANARINLTKLLAHPQYLAMDYALGVYRVSENNNGVITEAIYDSGTLTYDHLNEDWGEHFLATAIEFEVGDIFMVTFTDLTDGTDSKINYMTNATYEAPQATFVNTFRRDFDAVRPAAVGLNGLYSTNYFYAIDFECTVF